MRNYLIDPTANTAIGSVDRELSRKRKEAKHAARLIRIGKLSWEEENRLRAHFTGIFRRALEEALEEDEQDERDRGFPRFLLYDGEIFLCHFA